MLLVYAANALHVDKCYFTAIHKSTRYKPKEVFFLLNILRLTLGDVRWWQLSIVLMLVIVCFAFSDLTYDTEGRGLFLGAVCHSIV